MSKQKTYADYSAELKRWYNPRGYVIENHRKVDAIAQAMQADGFTREEIAAAVDAAREYWGLEKITRMTP